MLGTAGYMSPEQASGGRVDFPSDQFSFGAVLYEMLTGRRAFERPTIAETLSAIIREEPPMIAQLNPAVPPPVRWIVERCLAKDTDERYALTRDLARDLASAGEHLTELLASRRGRPMKRMAGDASLAVLPVVSLAIGGQQEALADAMTDALITELTECRGLRVISRISSMVYKGRRMALPDIAEELGVEWILLASIAKSSGEVRIAAQLVDAGSDENRWAHSYTRRCRTCSPCSRRLPRQSRETSVRSWRRKRHPPSHPRRATSLRRSTSERSWQNIDDEVGMMIPQHQ